MKKTITFLLLSALSFSVNAQNYSVNQNQQNVNINLPVIEKPVYIEKYRTVYVDRPQPKRVAKKLNAPIKLIGYLWVYPEDLGNFKQPPYQIIENLNRLNSYGHNNWRIPTPDELSVLEANADVVGLGDDIYMATDHANGVLRLVARPETPEEQAEREGGILVGNVIWAKKDVGANAPGREGKYFFGEDAREQACPKGWKLPTASDFDSLFNSGRDNELKFYYGDGPDGFSAKYWTRTKCTYKSSYVSIGGVVRFYWQIASPRHKNTDHDTNDSAQLYVRCVKYID